MICYQTNLHNETILMEVGYLSDRSIEEEYTNPTCSVDKNNNSKQNENATMIDNVFDFLKNKTQHYLDASTIDVCGLAVY